MNSKALWVGRFSESPDEAMLRFSTSLPIDSRLYRDMAAALRTQSASESHVHENRH